MFYFRLYQLNRLILQNFIQKIREIFTLYHTKKKFTFISHNPQQDRKLYLLSRDQKRRSVLRIQIQQIKQFQSCLDLLFFNHKLSQLKPAILLRQLRQYAIILFLFILRQNNYHNYVCVMEFYLKSLNYLHLIQLHRMNMILLLYFYQSMDSFQFLKHYNKSVHIIIGQIQNH